MDARGVEPGTGEDVVVNGGRRARAFAFALLAAIPAGGCEAAAGPPPPLTAFEEAATRTRGAQVAAVLQATLAPRLQAEIEAGGPAQAIRFCAAMADSLTSAAAKAAGYSVRRTSLRLRNPANAADPWERLALGTYERMAVAGDSVPSGLVQVVSAEEVRYYAPLFVAPVCLNCHGAPSDLAPGVADLLAELYPADEATGYRTGDLRGLIRVSIPRRELNTPDR